MNPPPEFASRFSGKPYDGEIAYVDQQIGKLMKAADQNVLWIVTADHGESLGEHGESTHGVFLYNATLHVPLMFAGRRLQKRIDPIRFHFVMSRLQSLHLRI